MKRFIGIICVILSVLLCTCPAYAKSTKYDDGDNGFSISLPDGYTALNRSNLSSKSDFIKRLGYSVKSFRAKMEDSDIVLYAADKDNRHQVQVRIWESDFSKKVKQLSSLDEERLGEALSLMADASGGDVTVIDSRVVKVNSVPYLTYTVKAGDSFCYVQDITVIDGRCVALVYYNSSDSLSASESAEQQSLLKSFKVENRSENEGPNKSYNIVLRIISAILVLVAAVVAVYIVSGFVNDLKNRKEKPESIPDHIKMRRK